MRQWAHDGPLAFVPMFGHSLFAQHFMPTLLLFAPFGRIFDAPTYLIVIQTLFYASAGYVFFRFASRPVAPAMALNLMAVPGRIPSGLQRWLPPVIIAMTVVSTPLSTSFARAPWKGLTLGAEIRAQLAVLPTDSVMLVQPNLIPHLTRGKDVHGLGVYESGQPPADYVVLARHGDRWPFTAEQVGGLIARYQSDAAWEQVGHGPLFVFRRRELELAVVRAR